MVKSYKTLSRRVAARRCIIPYTLEFKPIKNKNLRVDPGGNVVLSVPFLCTLEEADQMVREHEDWIIRALGRLTDRISRDELPPLPPPAECRRILQAALDRVFPLMAPFLNNVKPVLKIRAMTSQWGNCHYQQGYITLNSALARLPERLQDYVALHELVHFLYHDHGEGFYATMSALMPDWMERRSQMGEWANALVKQK